MCRFVVFCGLFVLLTACADHGPAKTYGNQSLPPKIMLDVQSINLADRSGLQPPGSPYNSNHFSPTIAEAVKQWAGDRLQAAGPSGQAIVVIKDASLIEQPMLTEQGPKSWFTRQQGLRYTARVEVSIEANGHQGFAMADGVATRTVTLAENPTATERQDAYYTLLNNLVKDLGQNLEAAIGAHMGSFLLGPQSGNVISSMMNGSPARGAGFTNAYPAEGEFAPVVIQSPNGNGGPSMTSSQPTAPVAPQISTISQSTGPATAPSTAPSFYAPSYTPAIPASVSQSAPPPQAPVFGTSAVPTVPDLASTPGAIPTVASAAPTPLSSAAPASTASFSVSDAPSPAAPAMPAVAAAAPVSRIAPAALAPQPFSGYRDASQVAAPFAGAPPAAIYAANNYNGNAPAVSIPLSTTSYMQ